MEQQGGGDVVEEASPISSRPPANQLEELMRFSGDDGGGGGGGGAAGAGGSSSSGANRWPREETLALLRIRSEMDGTFRDATLKAPLWEDVSRKLGELGYKRSAKKCKEKFENVQKYYKRTKEGKGGRNDGKAYKFFSQLEALNTATAAATSSSALPHSSATLDVTPLSIANPPPPHHQYHHQQHQQQQPQSQSQLQPQVQPQPQPQQQQQQQQAPFSTTVTPTPPFGGATLSSHSSSTASSMGYDDDDDEDDNMDVDPANTAAGTSSRKRKRMAKEHGSRKMMEFFEAMMRQVLQKQAAMQLSLLEALEKREQERISREEAWKRQEMSRLAREHELMAQERAASASRDAAIVSLIQKITGHTLHLPPSLTVSSAPPPPPRPPSPPQPPPPPQQTTLQQQRSQVAEAARHQTSSAPSHQLQPIMAIPEQQIPPPPQPQPQPPRPGQEKQQETGESGSSEPASSSRWPKTEVLALINLRSGMESKYQEAGPKGPLWEEISGGMRRMGYNRSAKRCKEKWENINKYYKKIKESSKKRPEDAKTCPYFHQLEALYRDKILGSSSSSTQHPKESSEVDPVSAPRPPEASHASPSSSENKNEEHAEESSPGGLSTQGDKGTGEKPEDIVRELMQRQQQQVMSEYEKMEVEEEQEGHDLEEEDMGYEMEFQQRDNGPNRGGNGRAPSFLTMVQ